MNAIGFVSAKRTTHDAVILRQSRYMKLGKLMPLASAISAQPCQSASSLSRHSPYKLVLP